MALECLYFGASGEFKLRIETIMSERHQPLHSFSAHDKNEKELYKGLYVIHLDALGHNSEFYQWLLEKKNHSETYFDNSIIGIVVKSESEFFTKKFTSSIIFLMNQMGARFLGHPVVEFIKDYSNLKQWQLAEGLSIDDAVAYLVNKLLDKMLTYEVQHVKNPKVLVLHAGTHEKSNTLALWRMVKEELSYDQITEFHVEEGTAVDCYGCSFNTCIYYSLHKSCFFGGVLTEELLPLIEDSDVIVWICPNYNDALSAKLTAVINRLTVLYRRVSFKNKKIYSLVVSANSGSDSVASQLIDALVINKGFQLPPKFALTALASEEGSIYKVPSIEEEVKVFAKLFIEDCLLADD